MDQPKIVKELQLLMFLANNRYATCEEICNRFEFSKRTFYRYIDTFREAGFVVRKNEYNIYKLENKENRLSRHLKELLYFSEEEERILRRAIDSIEPHTKAREQLKKKLYALYDNKMISDVSFGEREKKVLDLLRMSINGKMVAVLKNYRSAHSNTITDRVVEPFALTSSNDIVWCYELESDMVKIFKISRMEDVEITKRPWQFEDKHKLGHIDIFRIPGSQKFPVKLRLSLRAANLIMEEYPMSELYLKKTKGNRYILDTEVCSFDGIARFILGLYNDIEILESPELKSFINYKIKMLNK